MLCDKGVDSKNAALVRAIDAIENKGKEFDQGCLYRVGKLLDEANLGGSCMMKACVYAYAGIDNTDFMNEQIDKALAAFRFVTIVSQLNDVYMEKKGKTVFKETNRQTEVTDEQLIALNEFHRRLEAFYNTFTGNQRLFYERRSKQYNYVPDIEKVRIVSISTQIKAAASMFFDKPHLASRYYGRLLKSVDGIFDEGHKMLPYYTCTYLLYKLEYLFRNKLLAAKYRKYRFHMLMMIKYDFSEGKISELNSNQIEKLCEKILACAYDNMVFMQEIEKIIPLIEKCVAGNNESEITKMAAFVDDLKREICT